MRMEMGKGKVMRLLMSEEGWQGILERWRRCICMWRSAMNVGGAGGDIC